VLYKQERVFVRASDGAMVPMSLVYKIELRKEDEGNPLLLVGYPSLTRV
jgi:protease II